MKKKKQKKYAYAKYDYNIDTVQMGDKISILCSHENCNRFLVMVVDYTSTMQCHHKRLGSFDMRNQCWYCHQHKPKLTH